MSGYLDIAKETLEKLKSDSSNGKSHASVATQEVARSESKREKSELSEKRGIVASAKTPSKQKGFLWRLLISACRDLDIDTRDVYAALADEDIAGLVAGRIGPAELRSFAVALCERRGMERGIVPQGWTKIASCGSCGPVWLWAPGEFAGCPWCHVRVKGLPIPLPDEAEG